MGGNSQAEAIPQKEELVVKRYKNKEKKEQMAKLTRTSIPYPVIAVLFYLASFTSVSAADPNEQKATHMPANNQITNQVSDEIKTQIQQAAKVHQWPAAEPDISLRLPSGSHRLTECRSALDVQRIDRRRYPAGRLRFEVNCTAPAVWHLTVQADVSLIVPVAIAARTVTKDEVLTAGDITLKPTDIARINREFFSSPQGYVGLRALRQIRRGQQLSPSHLSPAYMVSEGDKVIIQASNEHFSANMSGMALEGGYAEQQIRVKNTSSGQVIKAKIAKPGLVTTLF